MYCERKCYIDTADSGSDYLCAIVYDETEDANYIVDVLFTQKPMTYTETATAELITKHDVRTCSVEANDGGASFKRAVEKQCRLMGNNTTHFQQFTQSQNKQTRIFTRSAEVQNLTVMPYGWERLFTEFANQILGFMKIGNNEHDDAADALTGTIEFRKVKNRTNVAGLFGI